MAVGSRQFAPSSKSLHTNLHITLNSLRTLRLVGSFTLKFSPEENFIGLKILANCGGLSYKSTFYFSFPVASSRRALPFSIDKKEAKILSKLTFPAPSSRTPGILTGQRTLLIEDIH